MDATTKIVEDCRKELARNFTNSTATIVGLYAHKLGVSVAALLAMLAT